jgi:predicted transposase YdaD
MSEEQPHDWLFKEIFSVPEHAASHLRSVLPAELVARIDWATLALENTRLHISGLDAKQADVLLSAQLAGRPALLYVVFEHQSTEDPKMPLRMLRYVLGVWSEYLKLHPATRTLPPVIPCVLHHGPAPWKSPTDVAAMVDVDDETRALLGPLIPSMGFLLDDLTVLDAEQLDARTSSAAVRLALHALHRFATTTDPVGELRKLRNLNREVLCADSGPQALSAVLWYLLSVNDADPQALQVVLEQTLGPPGTEALMTKISTVQRMTKEAAEQGRQEGQAHALVKLLTLRFKEPVPAPALARIRDASVAELDRWTERVLEAETLDDVLR